ncbi:lipopolysaccharide assembly protein LapA domain-containing protein [Desulfobacca acetoxidans]|uniref:Lipopolysaccharide assembly protein A domain-containing protein n=1 Tax=Desulfobacca acetoxidans (strain ATCC 700848 / DSM 11109 / ASRB2) TaxID=880072 RepID=F2NFW1_DESAR|nr:hypothetical protein Desac_2409 [Desulfobacca acetoxidans DSM 11109]HAY22339.1 DUF1049 domain-containing protein [Desulfobacterales bacterium]
MAKIKIFLLILFTSLLTYFIIENSVLAPPIKVFGKELIQLHTSLIIIIFFVLGFILGWLGHVGWRHRRRKAAESSLGEEKIRESAKDEESAEEKEKQE